MKFKNSDKINIFKDDIYIGPILNRKEMNLKYYKITLNDTLIIDDVKKCNTYKELKKYKKFIQYISDEKKYNERPDEEELIDDLRLIKKLKICNENYLDILGFNDELEFNNYQKYLEKVYQNFEEKNTEFADNMLNRMFEK
jgi:hypothetical protein